MVFIFLVYSPASCAYPLWRNHVTLVHYAIQHVVGKVEQGRVAFCQVNYCGLNAEKTQYVLQQMFFTSAFHYGKIWHPCTLCQFVILSCKRLYCTWVVWLDVGIFHESRGTSPPPFLPDPPYLLSC